VNIALKVAILTTVRTQVRLAAASGIPEDRISRIVNQWVEPTPYERRRIAGLVGQKENLLWPRRSAGGRGEFDLMA
jgi:hypothetical protein